MTAKNACEGILCNPQLLGAIEKLTRSYYRRNLALMQDSSFDLDDLSQELMLELCEELPRLEDSHYQRLATDRLKDIIDRLRRSLTDGEGGRVTTEEYADAGAGEEGAA